MQDWVARLFEKSPDFPALEKCLEKIAAVDSLADLPAGTRVLVRGDTGVVFDEVVKADDDSRLRALVETLRFGVERGWVQVLYGHRGRDPKLSLEPAAPSLDKLMTA